MAKVEEAAIRSVMEGGMAGKQNILEVFAVVFLVDRSINILMGEKLEDKW